MQVKWWITINEMCYVTLGYKDAHPYAPGVEAKGIGQYLAAHTLIQAHAKVYRLYEKKFKAEQKGRNKRVELLLSPFRKYHGTALYMSSACERRTLSDE